MHPNTPGTNQLAERIAFERPDSCLYEAVMLKYRVAANRLAEPPRDAPGEVEGRASDDPAESGEASA